MQMKVVNFFGAGIWYRVVGIGYSAERTVFGGIWFGTLIPNPSPKGRRGYDFWKVKSDSPQDIS
jgi:hypothetical protein